MKYVLFITIDLLIYPFLLLLYMGTWLLEKRKFVPLLCRRNNKLVCISETSSDRKK